MQKPLSILAVSLVGLVANGGGAAEHATGSYATDLSRVYDHTQLIRAVKEGCDSAHKATAAANATAYNTWRRRHKALLDDLEKRVTLLIHGVSTDQKDYSKNIGRYLGDITQHREILKGEFLAGTPESVERQCKEFPQTLRGDEGDLEKRFPEELKVIRKRKI
jgi:hypothetical protein